MIEPRRSAEALAKVHKHPGRFRDDDRVRAWALYDHAVDAHDQAFGRLMNALRSAGREDDNRWNETTRATVLRNYNQLDMFI